MEQLAQHIQGVSTHLLWTGTLEENPKETGNEPRPVSIHLLWTGTLEEEHDTRQGVSWFVFQSIFYGQVL